MSTAVHPLGGLRERLQATVAAGELERLRDFLLGLDLPVLGGQQEPADTLLQAVHYPTFDSALAEGLAQLLGRVLADESLTAELVGAPEVLGGDLEDLIFNALVLAHQLPAGPTLFEALQELAPRLEGKSFETPDYPPLEMLLRRSLIYQQTDESLESHWLGLIDRLGRETAKGGLSVQEQTLLLDSWRGLLWIPPPGTQHEGGSVIDFERLDKGLRKLSAMLTRREDQEQVGRWLDRVLQILSDSFPRSPEFWARRLQPFYASWPEELQVSAAKLWPDLKLSSSQPEPRQIFPNLANVLRSGKPNEALHTHPQSLDYLETSQFSTARTYDRLPAGLLAPSILSLIPRDSNELGSEKESLPEEELIFKGSLKESAELQFSFLAQAELAKTSLSTPSP